MEESSRIKMEEVKSKNVEVVKDTNNEPDIVNDLAEQKKKEREERKCLIQLIVVFVVWVTLIIILMRTEKRPTPPPVKQKVVATPAKAHHHSHSKTQINKQQIPQAHPKTQAQAQPPNQQKVPPVQNKAKSRHKKLYL